MPGVKDVVNEVKVLATSSLTTRFAFDRSCDYRDSVLGRYAMIRVIRFVSSSTKDTFRFTGLSEPADRTLPAARMEVRCVQAVTKL